MPKKRNKEEKKTLEKNQWGERNGKAPHGTKSLLGGSRNKFRANYVTRKKQQGSKSNDRKSYIHNNVLVGPLRGIRSHAGQKRKREEASITWKFSKKPREGELRLPPSIHSVKLSVPWMKQEYRKAFNSDSKSPSRNQAALKVVLPTDGIPSSLLDQLDDEVCCFASYVQLQPPEILARERFVQQINDLAKTVFPERPLGDDVSLKIFGSFAHLDVCTFQSDVDLALWGVVPIDEPPYIPKATELTRKSTATTEPSKEDRKRKWLEALEAMDEPNDVSQGLCGIETELSPVSERSLERREGDLDRGLADDQEKPFFVIDRVGLTDVCPEHHTVSETNDASSLVAIEKTNSGELDDLSSDSADKLESMGQRAAVEEDEHAVSVSQSSHSGTEDSSRSGGNPEPVDDSRLEISITAPTQSFRPQVITGDKKYLCVVALRRLHRRVGKDKLANETLFLKKARVPIIKIKTKLGFEADVAVGGHYGTTGRFAAFQVKRFTSFGPVVLTLKVMLAQQCLDVPFNGGLGSYKLYVLVASHIAKHLELGGCDRPGEILLSFLFRYGCMGRSFSGSLVDDNWRTRLNQQSTVRCDDDAADLSNVFLLDSCIRLFQMCWNRMMSQIKVWDDSNDGFLSVIATVVDSRRLTCERSEQLDKASKIVGIGKCKPTERAHSLSTNVVAHDEMLYG